MLENFRLVKDEEQNWAYDPDKACNGGGYHQPLFVWEFDYDGSHYRFEDNDTSCGDFGVRYTKSLDIMEDGKWKPVAYYGLDQMDDSEYASCGNFELNKLTAALIAEGLLEWYELLECKCFERFNYDKFSMELYEEEMCNE